MGCIGVPSASYIFWSSPSIPSNVPVLGYPLDITAYVSNPTVGGCPNPEGGTCLFFWQEAATGAQIQIPDAVWGYGPIPIDGGNISPGNTVPVSITWDVPTAAELGSSGNSRGFIVVQVTGAEVPGCPQCTNTTNSAGFTIFGKAPSIVLEPGYDQLAASSSRAGRQASPVVYGIDPVSKAESTFVYCGFLYINPPGAHGAVRVVADSLPGSTDGTRWRPESARPTTARVGIGLGSQKAHLADVQTFMKSMHTGVLDWPLSSRIVRGNELSASFTTRQEPGDVRQGVLEVSTPNLAKTRTMSVVSVNYLAEDGRRVGGFVVGLTNDGQIL
jgi:hypothetical protein